MILLPEVGSKTIARVAGGLGRALLWLMLVVMLLLALGLVAMNFPTVSHFVAGKVNALLAPTLGGQVVVRELGHVDLYGVSDAAVEVHDPAGHTVLAAREIDVRLFWPAVAYHALVGSALVRVPIEHVGIGQLDVTLIDDGTGNPTLIQAFEPRELRPGDPNAAHMSIEVAQVELEQARIGGGVMSVPHVDAEISHLNGHLRNDASGLAITLRNLELQARQLPSVDRVSGRLEGELWLPVEGPESRPDGSPSAANTPKGGRSPQDHSSKDQIQTQVRGLRPALPERRVQLAFEGTVAGSGTDIHVRLAGQELIAELQASELTSETLEQLVPALVPAAPVALTAKVEGQLQNLGLEAHLKQANSRLSARGRLRREDDSTHASVHLDAADVDLSRLLPSAPRTQIALTGTAHLDWNSAGSQGSYRLVSDGSRVAGEVIARTTLDGELHMSAARPLRTSGTLDVAEPGAATHVVYTASSGPEGLRGKIFSTTQLARAPRLREHIGIDARGRVELRAEIDEGAEQVDADVALYLRDVRHGSFSLGRLEAHASARGDLSNPELRARADGQRVRVAGRFLSRATLSAQGTTERAVIGAHVTGNNPDSIDLTAKLAPRSDRQIRSARLRICTGPEEMRLRAESVGFAGGSLRVERLTLDGPGSAALSLRYGRTLERLDLKTESLDAARLLRIAGIPSRLRSAQANLEAHISGNAGRANGTLVGDIREITYAELRGSLHTKLKLKRDRINGEARLQLAPGGATEISLHDVRLPLGARALQRLSGDIALRGVIDLWQFQSLLPLAGVGRAQGLLHYGLNIFGDRRGVRPNFQARVQTRSLIVVGQRVDERQTTDAKLARQRAPWGIRGIDANVSASLEQGVAKIRGNLFDTRGDLLDWKASWRDLPAQPAFAVLPAAFLRAPFEAQLRVPSRALARLPAEIRPSEIEGNASLSVEAAGTLSDPSLRAHAELARFSAASDRKRQAHLDVSLDAEYTPGGGSASAKAMRKSQSVLELDSSWTGDLRHLAAVSRGKSPVLGHLDLDLHEFPMGVVPLLQQHHVRGRVSGTARLKDYGKDGSVALDLRTSQLRVEHLLVGDWHAAVRNVRGKIKLSSEINGQAGRAEAWVSAPFTWGDRMMPTSEGPIEGFLQTRTLRLSALLPMLQGALSELDGKLDSKFQASIRGPETQLIGHAALRDGVVQIPVIGQRFNDIEAEMDLEPGILRIDNVKARGLSGGFAAQARVVLNGLLPTSAQASLKISEDDELPLTIQGEAIGDVWGNLQASYHRDDRTQTNLIDVNLDKVHVILPDASPRGLQDLFQPGHIRVGYHTRNGDFTPIVLKLPDESSPPSQQKTMVDVDLGSLSLVKGQQAEVDLTGKVQAMLDDELDVKGKIEAKRGQLDIRGKTFEIERGTVSFTGGAPDSPTISAVARYDSPAGYTVYAEYTGTGSEGKLSIRSEPPLNQDEIVTLLLFGSPDGSLGAGSGDSFTTALSVAGGTAVRGLNRAISDVTDLDVSTRVDTSTGAPRPELVLQLTPRVAAKVTEALGEPVPGQSPDRTFVTLDLRLGSNWSLSSTVGDRGATAFDMIWRRRY